MDRIGRYRIVGEVGRGAIGVVYQANDPAIGRDVAIKTVRLDAVGESREKLRERLFREPRSASVHSHNITTDEDGAVKITDFGIARFAAAERLSATRTITGTPNYISSEQVQGVEPDGRTDQFSLGDCLPPERDADTEDRRGFTTRPGERMRPR